MSPTASSEDRAIDSALTAIDNWLANGVTPVETSYNAATRRSAWGGGYTTDDEHVEHY